MCVQTTARRCPLTMLPAGNLFLFKIWVNSRRYTSLRASSNTVGPEHVFNFHALNFKCGPFWHILAVHDKDQKKKKKERKGRKCVTSQVNVLLYFWRRSKQRALALIFMGHVLDIRVKSLAVSVKYSLLILIYSIHN